MADFSLLRLAASFFLASCGVVVGQTRWRVRQCGNELKELKEQSLQHETASMPTPSSNPKSSILPHFRPRPLLAIICLTATETGICLPPPPLPTHRRRHVLAGQLLGLDQEVQQAGHLGLLQGHVSPVRSFISPLQWSSVTAHRKQAPLGFKPATRRSFQGKDHHAAASSAH